MRDTELQLLDMIAPGFVPAFSLGAGKCLTEETCVPLPIGTFETQNLYFRAKGSTVLATTMGSLLSAP